MQFKISYKSIGMYDILKPALAIHGWQCRASGGSTLAEAPLFADAGIHYKSNRKKIPQFFLKCF